MHAVRVVDGAVRVVDVPRPDPDAGVRVKVRAAGICGSDLHMIDVGLAPGVTLGHEISGVTDDGSPVAVEPHLPCGTCEQCRDGRYHLCPLGPLTMIGIGTDGGMAEEIVVPESCLVPLTPGTDLRDASLVEPLAVAVHGLNLAGFRPEWRVAIVGAGTIGLCALVAVVGSGGRAAVLARHDHQAAAAERLGGTLENEGGYDLVVETAGTESALATAVDLARPGGTVLLLSMHWAPTHTPGIGLWLKEVRLVPSMTYSTHHGEREMDTAAALLAQAGGAPEAIITHRFPLDAAAEAFACAADRSAGAIKVVLEAGTLPRP